MKYIDNLDRLGRQPVPPEHDRVDQRGDAPVRAGERDPRPAAADHPSAGHAPDNSATYAVAARGDPGRLLERARHAGELPPDRAHELRARAEGRAAADALLLRPAERPVAGVLGHRRRSPLQDPQLHEHRGRRSSSSRSSSRPSTRRCCARAAAAGLDLGSVLVRLGGAAAPLPVPDPGAEGRRSSSRRCAASGRLSSARWRSATPRRFR